jgi:hypothetical protein
MNVASTSNAVGSSGGVKLVVFDIVLFVISCVALFMAKAFPAFMLFWITISFGSFVVLLLTVLQYYFSERSLRAAEKRQKENIVPGYCPDYWTKAIDNATGKVICKNGFTGRDKDGNAIGYRFADASVPETLDVENVAKTTNAYKCKAYGSSMQFAAPWMEMKARCESVAY